MSTKEKWEIVTDWATLITSAVNSLASNNAIISDVQIDNSSDLTMFMDVSISLSSVTTGSGAPFIGLFLYPLNQDGSTYGDSRFSSAAAGPVPYEYYVGSLTFPASTTAVLTGALQRIILPPGKFKVVLWNVCGVGLSGSGNTVKYRKYNRIIGT